MCVDSAPFQRRRFSFISVLSLVQGCAGIHVSGGSTATLQPSGISVTESEVGFSSRISRSYQPGIAWNGVGSTFAGNCVHHAPHSGFLGSGNNNVFAGNNAAFLTQECSDCGAWYSGRSWVARGNVITGNTFFNISNVVGFSLGARQTVGVYLDDELAGQVVFNNSFVDCSTQQGYGILLGGGRDNVISGNTFARTAPLAFDNRGMGWQAAFCTPPNGSLVLGLSVSVNSQAPPYSTQYPALIDLTANQPCVPVGNVVSDNTFWALPAGAAFSTASAAQIDAWNSSSSNNNPGNVSTLVTPLPSCWWSASVSAAVPTPTPAPSGIVVPDLLPTKRGLAESTSWGAYICDDLASARLSWHYSWSLQPGNGSCAALAKSNYSFPSRNTTAYVAMAWGPRSVPVTGIYPGAVALLGFNEPNLPSQSNMTPAAAAALWPSVQATAQQYGLLLGSPAIVSCRSGCAYVSGGSRAPPGRRDLLRRVTEA